MIITCSRCSATAELWSAGKNRTRISYETNFHFKCKYFAERAKTDETLKLGNIACPHMDEAISVALYRLDD